MQRLEKGRGPHIRETTGGGRKKPLNVRRRPRGCGEARDRGGQMAQGLAVWTVHRDLLASMLMPRKQ